MSECGCAVCGRVGAVELVQKVLRTRQNPQHPPLLSRHHRCLTLVFEEQTGCTTQHHGGHDDEDYWQHHLVAGGVVVVRTVVVIVILRLPVRCRVLPWEGRRGGGVAVEWRWGGCRGNGSAGGSATQLRVGRMGHARCGRSYRRRAKGPTPTTVQRWKTWFLGARPRHGDGAGGEQSPRIDVLAQSVNREAQGLSE